ncbi:unnamed protein product, partial [Mesorhabditis spiculigera]
MSSSEHSSDEHNLLTASGQTRTVFLCGFVEKRWHNSSLHQIAQDLFPEYFICCNAKTWQRHSNTRELLLSSEAFIFFVNEFTLAESTCLLALQNAWHLMIPIIMLRPPRTKLVICARDARRKDMMYSNQGATRENYSIGPYRAKKGSYTLPPGIQDHYEDDTDLGY